MIYRKTYNNCTCFYYLFYEFFVIVSKAPNGYAGGPPTYAGGYGQPDYGAQPPAYPGMPSAGGMYPGLPQQGYPQPNYPGAQPNYPGAQPSYPGAQPSYPSAQPNYPAAQPNYPGQSGPQPGYPAWGNPGFQQSSSDGFHSGTVVNNGPGYPNNAGGSNPSAPSCKLSTYNSKCHKFL